MIVYVLALLIGLVAGLRALFGAGGRQVGGISRAASPRRHPGRFSRLHLDALDPDAAGICRARHRSAAGDSRTVPVQFGACIVTGAVAGAALGAASELLLLGARQVLSAP